MIIANFKDFPRAGRIIGFDWGAKRTGVAVSDDFREFVFVRPPIVGGDRPTQMAAWSNTERVVGIVWGFPLRTDGSESDTTKIVLTVAENLSRHTDLPICFIDETLTSSAASEESNLKTVKDIKEKLDSESARIILENAIAVMKRL